MKLGRVCLSCVVVCALSAPAWAFSEQEFAAHLDTLKKTVPQGFTVLRQPPFVVIGDEDPATVKVRATGTVKWAADMLKQDYFGKDPDVIIDIWLFRDKASYEKHTREVFGDSPSTPFGYYSETKHALIMNIGTGGGTLVHEMVHPFMRANFPACPAWLNEGLGSLYEQCGTKDGHIWGHTNWRLAGLQEAIRKKSVPSFKNLTSTTSTDFYGRDRGTNYAQARYLCYYLQEKGLLVKFYRQFVANRKDDPTGYKTLVEVLGNPEMNVFQKDWEAYVLGLTFP